MGFVLGSTLCEQSEDHSMVQFRSFNVEGSSFGVNIFTILILIFFWGGVADVLSPPPSFQAALADDITRSSNPPFCLNFVNHHFPLLFLVVQNVALALNSTANPPQKWGVSKGVGSFCSWIMRLGNNHLKCVFMHSPISDTRADCTSKHGD
uniref:Uncharacterized protein n=1 Tax=Eutreptiella gymnastica TaxID=73025 RepID=A0A7S1NFW8_9EUGL|mmetsp:Transcript_32229/g.57816  ORF Transcript_32229/g.57816 Transcript_32229/m.57816 type:complete len:151 (+) Transcript_32229:151-603(+)